MKTKGKVQVEVKAEKVEESKKEKTFTLEQEQLLKRSFDLVKKFEEDNQIIKDKWEECQKWKRERQQPKSPDSTSSEQGKKFRNIRNRGNTPKIKVIRLNTEVPKVKKEIILTPAPRVLAEREGRILPIEIPDEEKPDEGPEERPTVIGRYAAESDEEYATRLAAIHVEAEAEKDPILEMVERTFEIEAQRKVGYFEYLQERIAKLKLPRNKDLNLLEKFRSMKGTSTSSSSSSKRQERE